MLLRLLFCCVVFSSILSCVKDTDFDQAEAIALTPVLELDLVYFTIDSPEFEPTSDLGGSYQVTDVTDLRFLDDSFTVDALSRADFFFRFNNSIPQNFTASFNFVTLTDEPRYEVIIPIAAGSLEEAVITEYTEVLDTNEQIRALTNAARVIVTITAAESPEGLEGSLNLQSKTTYFVEY